ncbi:hypothetical protein GQ53DRAFT_839176 [Thozetella sp. PMI_491]|nr:hypothetical protein GQ53DRAFT_839176 [Thozetella sp. PMI_491]
MVAFNYLVPALYFNATVKTTISLGSLSTGSALVLGKAISGTLRSEPGFEPRFSAKILYGEDYPTLEPGTNVGRNDFTAVVVPDDGSTPFQMHAIGIQFPTAESTAIVTGSATEPLAVPYGATYSVWVPTFRGGGAGYSNLQDSIFVGSETVSSGASPGEFIVGVKISKVFNTNTNVVIGEEFPETI